MLPIEIQVIASGSTGNAYLVSHGDSRVLLDAGVSYHKIFKALGFKLCNIGACLITHEHKDHSREVKYMLKSAIDCYMTKGTADTLDIKHHRLHIVPQAEIFSNHSNFLIRTFATLHDATEPCGFVMWIDGQCLVYATDTGVIPPRISGLTHLIIECNYCDDILAESDCPHKERVRSTHLGLNQVKEYLKSIDTSKLKEIVLCHLSDGHTDAKRMLHEITQKVSCEVTVRIA